MPSLEETGRRNGIPPLNEPHSRQSLQVRVFNLSARHVLRLIYIYKQPYVQQRALGRPPLGSRAVRGEYRAVNEQKATAVTATDECQCVYDREDVRG